MERDNLRGEGRPIVKYRDTLRLSGKKRLNRPRCLLGLGLGGPKEAYIRWGPDPVAKGQLLGEKTYPSYLRTVSVIVYSVEYRISTSCQYLISMQPIKRYGITV